METQTPNSENEQPILDTIKELMEEARKWTQEAIYKLFSFFAWGDGEDMNWGQPWN